MTLAEAVVVVVLCILVPAALAGTLYLCAEAQADRLRAFLRKWLGIHD